MKIILFWFKLCVVFKLTDMKKVFLVLLCGFFSLLFYMNAAPVSESEAKNVAEKFCERKGIAGELVLSDVRKTGCYIFNSNNGGFVIVSSDDKVTPIWGYSKTGSIQKRDESSSSFYGWLNSVNESVDSLAPLIDDSWVDKSKWSQLRSGWSGSSFRNARFVTPLITRHGIRMSRSTRCVRKIVRLVVSQ